MQTASTLLVDCFKLLLRGRRSPEVHFCKSHLKKPSATHIAERESSEKESDGNQLAYFVAKNIAHRGKDFSREWLVCLLLSFSLLSQAARAIDGKVLLELTCR